MIDTEFYALRRLINTMVFLAVICGAVIYTFSFQKLHVGRDFFKPERGLGIANPAPDKDGSWMMPIEYERSKELPPKFFLSWEVEVVGSTIVLEAHVIDSSIVQRLLKLDRDAYGVSIENDLLEEKKYQVQLRNPDSSIVDLGTVDVRYSNDFGGERVWH